jgi:uncharacterized protein (TIGR00251 family)
MEQPAHLRADGADTVMAVIARPRARENGIDGLQGDALKVRVAAPPVDGAANEALESFLAGILGVGRSRVRVLRGASSRHKRVRVSGVSPVEVQRRLEAFRPAN